MRDDEIRPLLALTFQHDLRNRHTKPSVQRSERPALRYELPPVHRWKDLQDQAVVTLALNVEHGLQRCRRAEGGQVVLAGRRTAGLMTPEYASPEQIRGGAITTGSVGTTAVGAEITGSAGATGGGMSGGGT